MKIPPDCQTGFDALARGAWPEARAVFQSALDERESPEALEGLGTAAWWLDLADLVFDARERAYRLYAERGNNVAAARVAVWLAWDSWAFRGEHAVANGWLSRARSLLDGQPDVPERAWLELREGALALLEDGDPDRAHAHAAEGIRVARAAKSVDFEMLGRALQGLALVASGAVAEGMRGLDEVNTAVVAGDVMDLVVIGVACCYLIAACERVRDYDRATEWCTRLKAFCAKWGLRPLFAVCRTQYASICMWRGTWLEAEQELTAATEELAACRPGMTADGLVRLAELRRRQGRLVEAAEMFDRAGAHGLAALGRAELAFDGGDARAAAEQAERCLRHVPAHNRTDRAAGLDLLVRARIAAGDLEGARIALAELNAIATRVAMPSFRAAASLAAGRVALGAGRADEARINLEDAVDVFLGSAAPYELARARIDLAQALAALGRTDAAAEEAHRAIDLLTELHAELEIARATSFITSLSAPSSEQQRWGSAPAGPPGLRPPAGGPHGTKESPADRAGLSKRELEVLHLVAEGLNNQDIAERLFVSDHTIHRHVANIFSKLSVSSRAAAVAQAARRGLLG